VKVCSFHLIPSAKALSLPRLLGRQWNEYQKYDYYDVINVDKTKDIPMDYKGAIGVPITFFDKYNPEQFEILDACYLDQQKKPI